MTASNREVELIDFIAFARSYKKPKGFHSCPSKCRHVCGGKFTFARGAPQRPAGKMLRPTRAIGTGLSLRSADVSCWALSLLPVHRATFWEAALLRQARAIGTGLSLRSADASSHEQRRSSPEQPRVCAGIYTVRSTHSECNRH